VSGLTVTWSRFYSVVFLGLSDAVKQEFLTVDVHVINMFLCVGHLEKLAADPKVDPAKKEEYLSVASQTDNYGMEELGSLLTKYNIKSPITGNDILPPIPFNLMFQTSIGPSGLSTGFGNVICCNICTLIGLTL
jgi:hypothetical protein